MREACTQAYQKLASAVRKAAVSAYMQAPALLRRTSSSGGSVSSITSTTSALRLGATKSSKIDAEGLDKSTQDDLNEKRRLDQYKADLAKREQNKVKEAAYALKHKPLLDWIHSLPVEAGKPRRKLRQRVVIEVLAGGRERVRVEYHRL